MSLKFTNRFLYLSREGLPPQAIEQVGLREQIPALAARATLETAGLGCGSLVVEGEESGKDVLFREGRRVFRPAIGGEDGTVENVMGVSEPLGEGVVELGEGAVFQVRFGQGLACCVLWVEPVVAEANQFAGGVGNGVDDGGSRFRRAPYRVAREREMCRRWS